MSVGTAVGIRRRKLGPAPQAGAKSRRFGGGSSGKEAAVLFARRFSRTDRTTVHTRTDYGGEEDAVEAPIASENGRITYICIEAHDSSLLVMGDTVSPFSAMNIIDEVP